MTRSGVFLSLFGLAVASGCGSVAGKTPGNDMAMAGGGGDMATAAGGDMATAAGGDMAMTAISNCTAGAACQNGNGNGLCDGTNCNACTDTTDDGKCTTIYGAGNLCLSGVCAPGCRTPTDCGGLACTNNQCAGPCGADSDCTGANQVCDTTTTHACVTNMSCGGAADNTQCPVNAGDVCCSATCVSGACCGTAACTVNTPGDGLCNGLGVCQLTAGCTAPTAGTRYVNPTASAGGNGSQGCPYILISSAVNDLAAAGGTVILKGSTTSMITATQNLAAGVNIIGSDGSFTACTAATCSDSTMWPKINQTANFIGFNMTGAGARKLSFLELAGPGATSTSSGVHVTGAAVTLDHAQISGFKDGLFVTTGGTLSINAGLVSTANTFAGLYVDNGGSADVEAVTGDAIIQFQANVNTAGTNSFGIYVDGSGKLTVNGPTSPQLLIGASNNKYGVRFFSSSAGSSITGLHASANTADGLYVYAKSILKVRGSQFVNSTGGNGVHVVANGSNVPAGLSMIDFGSNYMSDAGNNTFSGNNLTGFCVDQAVALAATNSTLGAQGNTWNGGATCGATNPAHIKDSGGCTAGQDVSDDCAGAVTIANCSPSSCTPQPSPSP